MQEPEWFFRLIAPCVSELGELLWTELVPRVTSVCRGKSRWYAPDYVQAGPFGLNWSQMAGSLAGGGLAVASIVGYEVLRVIEFCFTFTPNVEISPGPQPISSRSPGNFLIRFVQNLSQTR